MTEQRADQERRAGPDPWDRLAIRGIEAYGHHGVLDFERRDGQVFVADLVLEIDTRKAARSDDLQDTVDYGTLVSDVREAIESDPVDLIETLAERIAATCLRDARVRSVEVTLHKPHAPIPSTFGDVALTITRHHPLSTGHSPPATGHQPPFPHPSTGAPRD